MTSMSLIMIGIGIGWLTGLSVSPTIATTLGMLTAIILAAFDGVKSRSRLDLAPVAIVVVAVCVGAATGILTRTHCLLGPCAMDADRGAGVLFHSQGQRNECARLLDGPESLLSRRLKTSSKRWANSIGVEVEDTSGQLRLVKALCAR